MILDNINGNDTVYDLFDKITVENLKLSLSSCLEERDRLESRYEDGEKEIPHHHQVDYQDNETIIYSLRKVINYFADPDDRKNTFL